MFDALGIEFSDHRNWLPARASDFPRPKAIKRPKIVKAWRREWVHRRCWWCGHHTVEDPHSVQHGELHHIARYDLPTCFAWLCASCHRHKGAAVTRDNLGMLLWKKHHWDREYLSWVGLAIALGRHLPDPAKEDE